MGLNYNFFHWLTSGEKLEEPPRKTQKNSLEIKICIVLS